jgi:hypothetical protein
VARLVRHGVQPLELLEVLCGVIYWQRQHPSRLPSDAARDFAVSHALLNLAPRPKRVLHRTGQQYSTRAKFAALQHLGKFLRVWLADFLAVVFVALDDREAQRASVLASLRQPFGPPVVAFLDETKPAKG